MTATPDFLSVEEIEREIQVLMAQAAEKQVAGESIDDILVRVDNLAQHLVELTMPRLAA